MPILLILLLVLLFGGGMAIMATALGVRIMASAAA